MKPLFNPKVIQKVISVLILIVVIKAIWLTVQLLWLPAIGIDHVEEKSNKTLYYRVKLTENGIGTSVVTKKERVKKPLGNIKDIKLMAIYSSSDITVITVQYKSKTQVLAQGESINGFVLEGAGSDFARFSKHGKDYEVLLHNVKQKSSYRSSNASSSKSKSEIPEVKGDVIDAGDHKIIDKSLLDHYTSNMDDIYKNIGLSEMKEGKNFKGFKVDFVKKDSPFAKLGLQRDDILKSVNGQEISSYNAAFEIYKNMKNVENLTLVIVRGDKELELEYEIN